jgi:UDP:flavonoid glycosyltransferase YjiC (YdhE family)
LSDIALLTWDGGGNVGVTVGVAAALAERGHSVTVVGPRSLQRTVDQLPVCFQELGISPARKPEQRLGYLLEVAQGTDAMLAELHRLVEHADALVIDCNLSWALQSRIARRTAVLVHTALGLYLRVWQAVLDIANTQRTIEGLSPLAPAADAWAWPDLLLVASLRQFDRPVPPGQLLRPVYTGPVSAPRSPAAGPVSIPVDHRPQVLISYSTDPLQNSPRRLQTALDALDALPVSVLATTSGIFAPDRLRVPSNAIVHDYLPLDSALTTANLVVCHAGHGTTMAALTHGVPLLCIPGLGRDQQPIANRVNELGLGIALDPDADSQLIQDAATTILADQGYRERAREFAQQTGHLDGAENGANEVLALLHDAPDT